jgi:hypothetical protein
MGSASLPPDLDGAGRQAYLEGAVVWNERHSWETDST